MSIVTVGDLHNFGRSVKQLKKDNDWLLDKPRSIFWEKLFFGIDSPILKILNEADSEKRFEKFAQLETILDSPRQGIQKRINEIPLDDMQVEKLLHDYMDLCAYALAFGIMDLNYENVLISQKGPVIVDVESLFFCIDSLTPTGLIANRNMYHRSSGLFKLLPLRRILPEKTVNELMDRFLSTSKIIDKCYLSVQKFFQENSKIMEKVPIRILLRNSWEYVRADVPNMQGNFYPEEIEQMKRGDIPYFFCYSSGQAIHYYKTKEYDVGVASSKVVSDYQQKYVRNFPSFSLNRDPEIYNKVQVPRAMLELYDLLNLFVDNPSGKYSAPTFQIELEEELVSIKTQDFHWGLIRQYVDEGNVMQKDNRLLELKSEFTGAPSIVPNMFFNLGV